MEELSGDWEKHLDLCSDRQWAENANKACCLLPLYDLRYNRDIQVFCEHFAVKEMFHWLLLPQGIPTTCSVSMANPWVCSHGWGDKVYFFEKKSNLIPGTLSGSPSTLWVSSARVSLLWGTFLILRKLTGLFHLLITDTKNIHATILGFQYFFQTSGMWASISQMWSGSISSLASFQCSTHRCGTCTSSGNITYSYSYTIFHFSTLDFLHS